MELHICFNNLRPTGSVQEIRLKKLKLDLDMEDWIPWAVWSMNVRLHLRAA